MNLGNKLYIIAKFIFVPIVAAMSEAFKIY